MIPWKTFASVATAEGDLQLRQRGAREFLITIDGRVLMTSSEKTSELAVATLACERLAGKKAPRVLIGGLGMAYTLRAALDALPPGARITVAELTREVADWCRGPLAPLTNGAALDPRVHIVIDDVAKVIARARPGSYDAIIFDLYEGPHGPARRDSDPFYGRVALAHQRAALSAGGILSVWSEESNVAYKRRMLDAGFDTRVIHPGGSRAYVVYLGLLDAAPSSRPSPSSRPAIPPADSARRRRRH